ncbi:MAG TPA: cyclase family protein [Pyrinomonadaceae bacterium]
MPLYDISVPIAPGVTPVYSGDPGIEIESWAALRRGDPANVSMLHFGAHTGTHVDAPAHFIEGAPGITEVALDALVGRARVVELPADVRAIDAGHVAADVPEGTPRVLFKTRNSAFWADARGRFREDFTYIAPDAARALARRGVRLVGIDYLSVEQFGSKDFETHLTLLSKGVVILEGLDLSAVAAGAYELLCLPLKIAAGDGDGAPARALLRTLDDNGNSPRPSA